MQRKYSEVVNYVPSFQELQARRNSRMENNNQKLSPVEVNRPSFSPSVYPNTQYHQFLVPNNMPQDINLTRNSSFQGTTQRKSLPGFYGKIQGIQFLNSPVMDSRQQNVNVFRSNGFPNDATLTRKINNQNFGNETMQPYNSPQNAVRNNQFEIAQVPQNVRRSMITTPNSPAKFNFFQRNSSQTQNGFLNPARQQPSSIPVQSASRQNRICHSMIITDVNKDLQAYEPKSPLLQNVSNVSNVSNGSNNAVDLQSTFSSDNYNSYSDLHSPLLSDQGNRPKKIQLNLPARKRQQVWKSMHYSPIKSQNAYSKPQFLGFQNPNGNGHNNNNNSLEKIKASYNNFSNQYVRKLTSSQNDIQKKAFYEPKTELNDLGKQSSGSLSPQLKFRKKTDYNTATATNNNLDLIETIKPKQVKEPAIEKKFVLDDFQVIDKLGRGTYGDVFLARQKKSRFICVLKSMSKKKIKELEIEEHVFRQIKIQSYLVHKHVTSLYGVFEDQNKIYLIMEFMPDGNMATNGKKKISQNETAHLIHQVCQGLHYMHKQDIIHRDIKPQNLLLNNTYLKIGDFGCAVFGNTLRRTIVGCYAYISPQQFSNNPYDQKIDSWCVGTLAYELLTGKPPFQQKLRKMALQSHNQNQQRNGEYKKPQTTIEFSEVEFPKDLKLSTQAVDFIKRLLDPDPLVRADIKQALKHKFLLKAKEYQKFLESRL